ncbi:hypothetical protein V8B97DRAFT_1427837 [Scleroderma yunnanense]
MQVPRPTKRICVIGAGPSGLAALKVLSESTYCRSGTWTVTTFEAREDVGGIWLPTLPTNDPPLTPLYDSLTTNLPHPMMVFTSFPFPHSTPLFPSADTVLAYLKSYVHHFHLSPLIRFNTTVISAKWNDTYWVINISTGESLLFDHLVVANGRFRLPRIPKIPGVENWLSTGRAIHSAWYRRPGNFGRKVLVIGGGFSGNDISTEVASHATTVIHSASGAVPAGDEHFKRVGKTLHLYDDGRVLFEGGMVEDNVDYCILATGFQLHFPFFGSDFICARPPIPTNPSFHPKLYYPRNHVFPLAKFLFPLQSHCPTSSLAFMVLPVKVAPLPLAEAQAYAIVRVFADPCSLNHQEETDRACERWKKLAEEGASTPDELLERWFTFVGTERWDYLDELSAFAAESGDGPGLKVREWEKTMYSELLVLKEAWRELERRNEAHEWVDGVGKHDVEEWVDMMERFLKYAKNKS